VTSPWAQGDRRAPRPAHGCHPAVAVLDACHAPHTEDPRRSLELRTLGAAL
jgi:hypothetical protein